MVAGFGVLLDQPILSSPASPASCPWPRQVRRLVGVLISVTTVPAAANATVATAYGVWHGATRSLLQLALNLGGTVSAGVLTLLLQQNVCRHVRTV